MRKLGISIYPEKDSKERIYQYLKDAKDFGASRIFSCLLSVTKDPAEIKKDFTEMNAYAHSLDFEVVLDVSPAVFNKLGISYNDLTFFKEIQADGIRLDQGFTGNEEAMMTFNPQGLNIEINLSNDTHTIDTIMDYQPDPYHLIGCHNFYPHRYTGLSLDHFLKCTDNFKKYGLRTAAFVGCSDRSAFGPWDAKEGLCTLEMHREMPLSIQVKHMIELGCIDDIIISNCYPNKEEMDALKRIDLSMVTFDTEIEKDLPPLFHQVIFGELQMNRGDINENMIRSTMTRVKYKKENFPLCNAPDVIHRGDVCIESSLHGHYAGEVQIAKKDMQNTGMTNVIGHIRKEELFLLDSLKPWQKFRFIER
jgi:hypothetical protein